MLAAANLIPGPNSTEMAIYIGQRRAGWAGTIVAGAGFILPAMVLVMAIAWIYVRYGSLPEVKGLLYGVKPVMIAVVVQALWGLARTAVRSPWHCVAGIAAAAASVLGAHELILLLCSGLLFVVVHTGCSIRSSRKVAFLPPLISPFVGKQTLMAAFAAAAPGGGAHAFGLWPLFVFFFKVGAVLYGSGYVLLAFLRADLVERWRWLSTPQLLDAVAVGQVTPGPLFTTATFIGYILGGPAAALVATLGIFLPAFLFVAVSGPLIRHVRQSPSASAFLDGVVVASLALMGVVTWYLGRAALVDAATVSCFLGSAALLFRYCVNTAWLVLGGSVVGVALSWIGWV